MTDTGPGGELRNTLYKTVTRSGRRMTRARFSLRGPAEVAAALSRMEELIP